MKMSFASVYAQGKTQLSKHTACSISDGINSYSASRDN